MSTNFRPFNNVIDTVAGKIMYYKDSHKVEYIGFDADNNVHVFRHSESGNCLSLTFVECRKYITIDDTAVPHYVWLVKAKTANIHGKDPVVLISFKTLDDTLAHIESFYDASNYEVVRGSVFVDYI